MPTELSALDESVASGDQGHAQKHSDLAYYVKRISALMGVDTVAASTTTMLLSSLLSGDLLARFAVRADGTIAMGGAPLTVSTVAGTTTVTVTTTASHGYGTADVVTISGVAGFVGADGTFTITRTGATTFTLDGVTGSGTYTSGGTVQRLLGTSGSANEGVWNLVVPEGEDTRFGFVIRLNSTSSRSGFKVVDNGAADIFVVQPTGGAGLISADANDILFCSFDTTGRSFAANTRGGVRMGMGGDPAGGVEVLAIGDATTPPTGGQVPDGTHTAESGFTTTAGAVVWGPVGSGGRLHVRTRAGHEDELIAPVHRRQMSVAAPGGGTTLVTTGTAAPTVATTDVTPAADDTAAGPGVSYTTTAAADVDAGIVSAFGPVQTRWGPLFYARIMTDASAITSTRLWAGLTSAELATLAADPTTQHVAAFRYDTGLDGTAFWRCVTAGGSAATVTTSTVAIAANTSYELKIEVDSAGTAVRFYVNGTLAATHTTNLPTTSTALGYTVRLRTLAAAARALRFGRTLVSSK
jgi:hypothetical protein